MNELVEMVRLLEETESDCFLATVMDVDGSAYRRPGARMLFCADGERVGSISGGCLERELIRTARTLTMNGPRLVTFDTRTNHLHPGGRYGQGCQGLIHILIERLQVGPSNPLTLFRDVLEDRVPGMMGTVYLTSGDPMPSVGQRFFQCDGRSFAESNSCDELPSTHQDLLSAVEQDLLKTRQSARPRSVRYCWENLGAKSSLSESIRLSHSGFLVEAMTPDRSWKWRRYSAGRSQSSTSGPRI